MPLYRCAVAEGATSLDQRARIAQAITDIHCEITGAPPTFVHAFFNEVAEAELPDGKQALVFGSIRAGRTPEQQARLASDMARDIGTILGCSAADVLVATVDVPARWIMEGGAILPEPGEEAEWLAKHGA